MQIQLAEVPDLAPLLEAIERGERVTIQKPDGMTVIIIKEPSTIPIEDGSRGFGSDRGKIWMSDDFDEPLEDFREYME